MRLIPLGTSSGVPTLTRNVSAVAVDLGPSWVLFDCGEGTQQRLLATRLKRARLEAVFITHLHGDHVFGLAGLLSTFGLQSREQPLEIYGPRGLRELIETTLRLSSTRVDFGLTVHEIPGALEIVSETSTHRVGCGELEHRVQALGYRLLDKTSGCSVVYCTDTRPCEGARLLASGADVLIHEATYESELSHLAAERGHATAAEAAGVALAAGVGTLVLTHFSPRYPDTSRLLAEARAVFPSTVAARELHEIEIGVRTSGEGAAA
jgi:ribonuclease Z